jgi:hypothetical protein
MAAQQGLAPLKERKMPAVSLSSITDEGTVKLTMAATYKYNEWMNISTNP